MSERRFHAIANLLQSTFNCLRERTSQIDRRDVLINTAISLVTILLVLGTFEGALRSGLIGEERPIQYQFCEGPNHEGRFHPDYGWTEVPNSVYLQTRSPVDDWHLHRNNEEGFRDTFDSGREDVIVLGDSFTEGALADDNATYPFLLDVWTPDTAFQNYGKGGYNTAQELIVYRNISDQYEHDVVILTYIIGADARSNLEQNPRRPRFALSEGELVQVHEPVDKIRSSRGSGGVIQNPIIQSVQDLLRHTETYNFFAPRAVTVLDKIGVVDASDNQLQPPEGQELEDALNVTRALFNEVAYEAEENDATLLLLGIPTRGQVNPDRPHFYEPEIGQPYWDADRGMIKSFVESNTNVEFLDITPDLREEYERGQQVYGEINGHLNEDGYRVTAQTTYSWLVDRGFVSNESNPIFNATYDEELTSCP